MFINSLYICVHLNIYRSTLKKNYLNDREGAGSAIIFCRILAPTNAPPPPTPQYLTILIRERGGAIIFCRILSPPNAPHPTPQYLTILMTERGAPLSFVGFWRPSMPPPPDATILNYLNDRERGRYYLLWDFVAPPPPMSGGGPDATILNYLNDREGVGAPLSFVGFWRPPMPPRRPTPQYLAILMTERGGAIIFCGILAPPNAPPPRRHNT